MTPDAQSGSPEPRGFIDHLQEIKRGHAHGPFPCSWCALIEATIQHVEGLEEELAARRKRLSEQRRQISGMNKKIVLEAVQDPEVTAEEIAERQSLYLDRIEDARDDHDVEWLANELIDADRQKQNLIEKCRKLRDELMHTRARRHRKVAS